MSFEGITRDYLRLFQQNCREALDAGASSLEMATRPVVHDYIRCLIALCKNEDTEEIIHHDVTYTKQDRPDWRIEDGQTFGVFCLGDHKSLNINGPFELSPSERRQIDRYLGLGRPVFVFDGVEFLFFSEEGADPIRCQIINKPLSMVGDWGGLPVNTDTENQFRELLQNTGFRRWTENALIEQLARRARMVSDEMGLLLNAPLNSGMCDDENALIEALKQLREIISTHHDPSLRDESACAGFVAQVLTFGLFYAHTRYTDPEAGHDERGEAIKEFWSQENMEAEVCFLRPFKAVIESLSTSLAADNFLSDWYKDVLGVLSHALYMGTEVGPRDFHILFEKFLENFDNEVRFNRGAFYTPKYLAEWTARASNELSLVSFGMPILEAADKVIDPCCGTGSFLEAIYSLGPEVVDAGVIIVGFEILPAPYALAHYRLAEVFPADGELSNLKILLTDTLSDKLTERETANGNGFDEEMGEASNICVPPTRLVIGNPPSTGRPSQCAPRSLIEEMLEDFRPPLNQRTDRQNTQQALNNEAYRFLRWSCERIVESSRGILALVLPGSFADAVSFNYTRKWLLERFKCLYVLELDADGRTFDHSQSIFNVQQARLVLLGVYDPPDATEDATQEDELYGKLYHLNISSKSKDEKIEFLENPINLEYFTELIIDKQQFRFTPQAHYPVDLWGKCWPLTSTAETAGIFTSKCSGVKLAPTAMLFHTERPILQRRSLELGRETQGVTNKDLIQQWFAGQQKPPSEIKLASPGVKTALANAGRTNQISKYSYRPFTQGYVLNSEELFFSLSAIQNAGTRSRPELRAAFSGGGIAIAVAPSTCDVGATLTRFASFAWELPDNDNAARGNAMIYSDKMALRVNGEYEKLTTNINELVSPYFSFSECPDQEILFYVYAIMCSSVYLEKFEGVLYGPSNPNDPARIPITSDLDIRTQIADLGRRIAEAEKEDFDTPIADSLAMSWNAPEGGIKLKNSKVGDEDESLVLTLSNEANVISAVITGVPSRAVALSIAGHNVISKWLREREFRYLRRNFKETDLNALARLISRIEFQLDLIGEVDELLNGILESQELHEPPVTE